METYEQLKLFMTGDELRAEYSTPESNSPNRSFTEPVILSHSDKVVLEGEAVVMYAAADQLVPVLYKD
jgi:hypothetical protein|tara:strand:+ start:1659 stop:1862 length:204 start_codon:yes stop_codon:yes gene_type:complete